MVRSSPSIIEAINYFEGGAQGPAHDRWVMYQLAALCLAQRAQQDWMFKNL